MIAPDQPVCTILAGPNGSGKSSILAELNLKGEFINADNEARAISAENPQAVSIRAGKVVLQKIEAAIAARRSFTYETTLSSHQSIKVLKNCRAAGCMTLLLYVTLEDVELNIKRIAERVARGGHDIPEAIVLGATIVGGMTPTLVISPVATKL